jgi:PleD family two-component response regulator
MSMQVGLGRTREPGWVLVVMQDAMRGMALFRLLEWAGHRATVVHSGRAALDLIDTDFDLVLLDASMPEPEGFEVLRRIRVDSRLSRLPVLMIVSEGEQSGVGPWIDRGADDVLTVPLVPVVARARISASLARKHLADREVEHRDEIGRIVEAVVAARDGTLDESRINAIVRCDPLGRLRRALNQIAAEDKADRAD